MQYLIVVIIYMSSAQYDMIAYLKEQFWNNRKLNLDKDTALLHIPDITNSYSDFYDVLVVIKRWNW
jgi:hypothetical protein